jgi:hypothetical protein
MQRSELWRLQQELDILKAEQDLKRKAMDAYSRTRSDLAAALVSALELNEQIREMAGMSEGDLLRQIAAKDTLIKIAEEAAAVTNRIKNAWGLRIYVQDNPLNLPRLPDPFWRPGPMPRP